MNYDPFMKTTIAIIWVFFIGVLPLFSQSGKFKYSSAKVDAGTVYHYVKTDKNNHDPENIAIYFAAPQRLEVFKYHEKGTQAAHVIATLDYKLFQADILESWSLVSAAEKRLAAKLKYDASSKSTLVQIGDDPQSIETTKINFVPYHVYNFDLTSLNFMMRHLISPKSPFKVGIADPSFSESGPSFIYRGEAAVEYIADEKRNGVDCRKYKMDGPGVSNRGGFIWVRKSGEFIQEIDMDLPDNPNWQSFVLLFQRTEKMTSDNWKRFITAHFEPAK